MTPQFLYGTIRSGAGTPDPA